MQLLSKQDRMIKINSILLACLISVTILSGFITKIVYFNNNSVLIAFILFVISIIINKNVHYNYLILTMLLSVFLLINALVLNNSFSFYYLFQFIFNCVFMSYIVNYKFNFKIVIRTLILLGILYTHLILPSTLNSNDFVAMRISYALLPSCLGFIFFVFNRKYITKIELVLYSVLLFNAFNFIIFSGSRGAVFSLIVYIFILAMSKLKRNITRSFFTFIIILFSFFILYKLEQLLINLAYFLSTYGIDIQWLERSVRQMNTDEVGILSGRTDLYYGAIELIKQNPILGAGVGTFDSIYGIYPHNLILELMCVFGIVGSSIFLYVIIYGFYKSFTTNVNIKVIILLLFSLSIPQLMFSNSFWLSNTFWMYFLLSINLLSKKIFILTKGGE